MDNLDISILKVLSTDSRKSDHSIATQLHVSTNTVKNRIRTLVNERVILGFETHLSATFFNATHCWLAAQIHARGQRHNEPEEKFITELGEIENVNFIMPTTENLLFITMDFFNSTDLDNTIQRMTGNREITGIQTYIYSSHHLHKRVNITPLDWKIIKSVRFNSRKSSSEIAKECDISRRTVNRTMRRLYNNGVIHHTITFNPLSSRGTIACEIMVEYDPRIPRNKIVGAITSKVKNLFNHFVMINSPTIMLIFLETKFSDIHDNESRLKTVEGVRSIRPYFCTKLYYFKDWRDKLIEENTGR